MYKYSIIKLFNRALKGKYKKSWIYALIIGFFSGYVYIHFDKAEWYSTKLDPKKVHVCFTPPSGCGELIAREISQAKDNIFIQAYGFTSKKIINEIIEAKNRGVKISILLDKSNLHDQYSKKHLLEKNGIKVYIDKASGIAHNKVMIIDQQKVITGSFNFTNDADKRNVENVLIINDHEVAKIYTKNWIKRYKRNY